MPLYALPLTATSHPPGASSAVRFQLPSRKRKRSRSSSTSSSSSHESAPASRDHLLSANLINPLSLSPAEVAQYRLAGLDLDQQLPSTTVKDFPHRGLPLDPLSTLHEGKNKGNGKSRSRSRSEDAARLDTDLEEENANERTKQDSSEGSPFGRPSMLRIQHLSVLNAILHRCLDEGDIPRASRAWALLIRAEVGGKAIDLRGSGYWGIGAELLIRSQEEAVQRREDDGSDEANANEEQNAAESPSRAGVSGGKRRWGSAEGLEKAKDYYERLILQHPYKRQYPNSVSALDFWPAMIGCEIYGIQYEQQDALWKVSLSESDSDEKGLEGSDDDSEDQIEGDEEESTDGISAPQRRRNARRAAKRAGNGWQQREEIRITALTASDKVAARLDELMTAPPYSDSHVLLRLRGMLALYIGDLNVPAEPVQENLDHDQFKEEEDETDRNVWSTRGRENSERRMRTRQRMQDHRRGVERRKKEWMRAMSLFERVEALGGSVDIDFRRLGGEHGAGQGKVEEENIYDMEE